jgi:hypothetical protein
VFDSGQLHYYLFVYLCPDVSEGEADFMFLFYWAVPHPGDRAQDFFVRWKGSRIRYSAFGTAGRDTLRFFYERLLHTTDDFDNLNS